MYLAHNKACTALADPTTSAQVEMRKFRLVPLCYSQISNPSIGLGALKHSDYGKCQQRPTSFFFFLNKASTCEPNLTVEHIWYGFNVCLPGVKS